MAGKPPYFPFYVNDFAASSRVEAMTTEQVGAYLLLLCKAWHQEPPGSIPADDTVLARWSRLTPERWAEIKPAVLAAFTSGADDRLHQPRMREEYAKLRVLLAARSKGGKMRWQKGGNSSAQAQHKLSTSKGSDSDSNSGSGPSSSGKGGKRGEGFDEFWAAYPKKQSKVDARKAWAKLDPSPELRAAILTALSRQKTWDQWRRGIIPHPATWLNARRWEDEAPPASQNGRPPPKSAAQQTMDGLFNIGFLEGPSNGQP